MSAMQRTYYKEVIAKDAEVLNGVVKAQGSRIHLLNILPQLRKVCDHPYLFPGAEPEPFVEGSHFARNSGKLFVLHQILPRLKQEGHRILIFSQSPPFLDIIQDFLTLERKDPETFVFLFSTRAGGMELSLQSTDTIVFTDSDFNPQMDLQAVALAYRLGQSKPIHVTKSSSMQKQSKEASIDALEKRYTWLIASVTLHAELMVATTKMTMIVAPACWI
ncbi:unnamed protein product [Peronospora destructor]|uniref:Helicase C-terminal domain-containing protein n=1 Tax=Peronospora destructor TaxID=86335 RepID=A0AAV0V2B3_9STRA|nr:unnamed protein product [Peronospora destructor]